ncbi:hypothetical protein CTAYLR_003467 [Chrysophaeum taylorii]|uniref:Sugar phosphate transporter domain-containing protein n=1 Tax=Chrysophaeum taylorii TaxID=2483200 RepID=A0AAD7U8J4_9STRA|nr:hypothetical protein CTAYLR_003467 [Chrysophaeum taylorii]
MLGSSFPETMAGTPLPQAKARLVEKGVTFTNAFIHVPICNPSRSTTLTGRYFHNLKTTGTPWAAMHVDMGRVYNSSFVVPLRRAGYSTGLFGKYLNDMPDYKPQGWDVFFGNGGGDYLSPTFQVYDLDVNESWPGGYATSVVGNVSVAWLRNQTGDFFCYVAPKAAHEPFNPAPWYSHYWDPSWPAEEKKGKAWNASYATRKTHGANVPTQLPLTDYAADVIAGIWRNRWRTLMSVDDLIAALDDQCSDCYFFFTSDHGFQLGQFNMLMDKRHVYDWDTRVHLVVKGPGIVARHEHRLVTNVDLAPTFLDVATATASTNSSFLLFDGKSLKPLLFGDGHAAAAAWRTSVLIEYYFVDTNDKCLVCNDTADEYPYEDSNCADLDNNDLCWCTTGDDCYPTEDYFNNFIGLRLQNATHDLLYAKYENGSQYDTNLTFSEEGVLFYELFDARADPWMMSNLLYTNNNATTDDLEAPLMAWFWSVGITLWYVFNVGYNVYNKILSKGLDYPMMIALVSLGVGPLYFLPLWALGIRKAPKLSPEDLKACTVLSMLHTVGHVAAVVAMSAGAVSFTHIIKALEPMFSVIFGVLINNKIDPISVNIWLLPIIAGVAWAAVGSKIVAGDDILGDINPIAFAGAMTSNIAFALRGILSKKFKAETKAENLTSSNLYSVMTLLAFFLFLPFALVLEGGRLSTDWPPVSKLSSIPSKIMGVPTIASKPVEYLYELSVWTGLYYYMYNEMAYLVLGEVSATAQAVANTVKRVVILLATVAFLGETMDFNKGLGSAVAICATMAYSIAKNKAATAAAKK